MGYSIVEYYGRQKTRCGYCKGVKCSIGDGMHAYTMAPKDYQDLIDRGWRRSGHFCYKQDNTVTCCPHYTIKCEALNFKLSKSHKKIIKNMNRFLRDGKREKQSPAETATESQSKINALEGNEADNESGCCDINEDVQAPDVPLKNINLEEFAKANGEPTKEETKAIKTKIMDSPENANRSAETLKPPCKKAKQMRLERCLAKKAEKGLPVAVEKKQPRNQEKTLQQFLNDTRPDDKHKLKLQLVHVESEEFRSTLPTTYALYAKYQKCVHNDPPKSTQDYLDFLQSSPLQLIKTSDSPAAGYGSFHQQYWLDDKLIAVSVIDILPYCVSAVYFFYDPDYSFLSLGTYSSLREIELVQQLASTVPALKYYYMGFYIHSCPKMRYKGKLSGSYLLCPETYTWHLLTDELRSKLDVSKYLRFNEDASAKDENEFNKEDMSSVLLLIDQRTYVKYHQYKSIAGSDQDEVIMEYARLVGRPLAHRMLYVAM